MLSYAIVQVQGQLFEKGEKAVLNYLEDLVPSHGEWYDLTHPLPSFDRNTVTLFSEPEDVEIKEDVIGMYFHSVGDWNYGYQSFFDHEVDMTSLNEVIEPYKKDIVESIKKHLRHDGLGSMLTLWMGSGSEDYYGEYEFEYSYLGVINPSAIRTQQ